jgi:dipeptidase
METLLGVKHLTQKGDYIFSFDLQDGFYALGINPEYRDHFNVNVCG